MEDLIFHCGAGSSSLVFCDHEAENTNVAYKIRMRVRYLNGDSGFGGNRLTCLLFMYLKIRVMLDATESDEEIFDERLQEAYSYVDQYGGTKEVYERFERLYEQAETISGGDRGVSTRELLQTLVFGRRVENCFFLWGSCEHDCPA